ncbi:type IVB secretion system protein IcmH/DotU [Pseudomonas sp. DCB_CB]|jgi:type VI secretion system protein ImpK|uniref:type IVB secretion system protein IcmH/DotU n=1 Tax=Pseudomonas TaxID=286 RepID=UPI0006D3E2C8|nr:MULTISPECIES: type IVB secretion system protein IcmH/DotU [Pseudomonas]AYN10005.1 DotU family type IV/VI secretion system protein [Pseudomonas putida]EKT4542171.1 type IVB secretion system protein IcmH/DotU [Pseudomonas putida]EKT4569576.1 type IVB secretion system protein IcmH/DotU [Pseudomonas putida]MCE0993219.1 type IVB secretion system protein IcmH/DotU [Pseudomonas alloputida]MCE1055995.1 type IVB secretion system protein IcmH/DotU [Pseudomonas alloputida]
MENSNPTLNDAKHVADTDLHAMLEKSLPNDAPAPATSTASAQEQKPEPAYQGYPADPEFQLRGGCANLMLDAAAPLFGLVMRLRTLDELPNIKDVHQQVRIQIDSIREEIRQHGYEPAQLLAYSYGLCLYIDEAVMDRPWGKSSCWSHEPLLSIFHDETWGGEKFFTVLSRLMQEPKRYQDVLEFMYFALCLGLKGKYAIAPKGEESLNALIHQLHGVIRELRGPTPEEVCDPYTNVAPRNFRMSRIWPWWSPLVISAIAMAVAYGIYSYRLHLITTEVLESLNGILQQ